MNPSDKDLSDMKPIGVVSSRTGISQDLIRAWERRYGAVKPHRTATGRRLYSHADLRRLLLIRELIAGGRRISDVAPLRLERLEALAEEDRQARPQTGSAPRDGSEHPNKLLAAALDAVSRLDSEALEETLASAALTLSAPVLRDQLLVPLLHEIGDRWQTGTLRVVHEHVASSIVRRFVEGLRRTAGRDRKPRVVVTTLSSQRHEFGALLAAAAAEEAGWEAVYLGPDLPAAEIVAACHRLEPRAAAVSVIHKGDEQQVVEEIQKLRRQLNANIALLVGGRAAAGMVGTIEKLGAIYVADFIEFQSSLETLLGERRVDQV